MKKYSLIFLLSFVLYWETNAQAKEEFNVLLIHVDDLGWADIGVLGSDFYETPFIDRLAAEGMLFRQSYAAAAICSPSRAALMTGKYPARMGITDWIYARFQGVGTTGLPGEYAENPDQPLRTPKNQGFLPLEELTLAERMKAQGYTTYHVGKWHLGGEENYPEKQGFDRNFGGNDLGQPPSYFDPYEPATPTPFYAFDRVTPRDSGEYLTDREGDEIVNFLQSQANKFFIHWAPYAVHTPLMAPQALVDKYKRKASGKQKNPVYAAMLENLDQNVGKVLAELDRLKLTEKTLVIFTSDNGGLMGNPTNPITNNEPLRSQKGYPYEGGIRVPTVVKWPGKVAAGKQSDLPIVTLDWAPTILDYLGLNSQEQGLDGQSLAGVLAGGALESRDLFWHFPHYRGADVVPYSIIRSGEYKLIHYFDMQPDELFSLVDDPYETTNLAAQFPELASQLKSSLKAWWLETGARMPQKK
ncbi:MAG: sulfatase [Algoriphagus sp.]|nr:sulfatase [Algoriphagus sp.]